MATCYRYTSSIHGATSVVGFKDGEGLGVEQLGGLVEGGGNKGELVLVKGHLVDIFAVVPVLLEKLQGVGVEHTNASISPTGDDGLVQGSPHGVRDLHFLGEDDLLWIACR